MGENFRNLPKFFCCLKMFSLIFTVSMKLKAHSGSKQRGHRQRDVIIMDFAQAFDKVPYKGLLLQTALLLHFYWIRGSTHKWIASWLSER